MRAAVGATGSRSLSRTLGLEVLELPPGANVAAKIEALRNNPNVRFAEADYALDLAVVPNDASYDQLWGMHGPSTSPYANVYGSNAAAAWANGYTGSDSIVVGVIDTGVQNSHPDLAANMWTNPGEIAGNGVDDDGNGFVDDVHGYDFFNEDGTVYDTAGDDDHG